MAEVIKKEQVKKQYLERKNSSKSLTEINNQKLRVVGYCRVSTDKDEQMESFENQLKHFEYLASHNDDWELVNVYKDYGISGGSTKDRNGFKKMMDDAYEGKFDIIVVKNMSRLSRNTIDTLNIVKEMSERHITIIFEEEHINTHDMVNRMVLQFLSIICEQELINTSNHVKQTFKNKMKDDQLVGSHRCLGYDCNTKENTMTIIPEEAEVVKYIFKRYLEGTGSYRIAKELTQKDIKTMRGNARWSDSVIRGILRNEAYVGDVIQGKSITVDPLMHRRLENKGEQEMYKISNHHEPIISREDFEKAQEIYGARSKSLSSNNNAQVDEKTRHLNTKMYPFSSIIYCGFCGSLYTHRILHSKTKNEKEAWSCYSAYKLGRSTCKDSKTINQDVIEKAFVEAFNKFTDGQESVIDEYIKMAESTLNTSDDIIKLKTLRNTRAKAKSDNEKLLDVMLSETSFNRETLNERVIRNNKIIANTEKEIEEYECKIADKKSNEERLVEFRNAINLYPKLEHFNKDIFLAVVEKVIIGKIDDVGNKLPYAITFVFKTGTELQENGEKYKAKRGRKKLCTNQSLKTC